MKINSIFLQAFTLLFLLMMHDPSFAMESGVLASGSDSLSVAGEIPPLHATILSGGSESLESLLGQNSDLSMMHNGMTVLHRAALVGNEELVKKLILLKAPVDVQDFFGNTPLLLAVREGHAKVVRALVRSGALIDLKNSKGRDACYYALKKCALKDPVSLKMMRYLILSDQVSELWKLFFERVVKVDQFRGYKLSYVCSQLWFLAVGSGNRDFVKFLLSLGVDITTQQDSDSVTALQLAASKGLRDMVVLIMERSRANQAHPGDRMAALRRIVTRKQPNDKDLAGKLDSVITELFDSLDDLLEWSPTIKYQSRRLMSRAALFCIGQRKMDGITRYYCFSTIRRQELSDFLIRKA